MPFQESPKSRVRWPEFAHVIFDCDSTLSAVEGIDVLAGGLGLAEEIASLTDAAMAGDVDLNEIYGRRLRLLEPSKQAIAELRSEYKRHIVPDAREVVATLQDVGIQVYVVSGGLAEPVADFAVHLGIEAGNVRAVAARHDELSGDWWKPGPSDKKYAGFETGALTRSDGKAEVIAELLAGTTGLSLLVGDGASDLNAAGAVDLFVGYGGVVRRDRVAAEAAVYVNSASLAPVLPIAAGPGGRDRIGSAFGKAAFSTGVDLIASGAVTFRDSHKKEQLLAALELEHPNSV